MEKNAKSHNAFEYFAKGLQKHDESKKLLASQSIKAPVLLPDESDRLSY
jgi:hypothetical protein